MKERYRKFNVAALQRVATESLNHGRCVSISKFAEGMNCKVFLLGMEDGFEAIAKLPTAAAGPRYYLTSSEVATMDFLRSELSIPVPRVYVWNPFTSVDRNPVGAEYIIMEKVEGVQLADCWGDLTGNETLKIMKQLASIEAQFFERPLSQYGSIYYKTSLNAPEHRSDKLYADDTLNNDQNSRWCIGPSANSAWWYQERADMNIERGPCKPHHPDTMTNPSGRTSANYVKAVSARERAWASRFARPQEHSFLTFKSGRLVDPSELLVLLDQYDALIVPLMAHEPPRPIIRHPDLRLLNIFVHPESKDIVGIIDWQETDAQPLSLHSGFPFLANDQREMLSNAFVAPPVPDYGSMDEIDKHNAKIEYTRQRAHHLYFVATGKWNPVHFEALRRPFLPILQRLVVHAGRPWAGNNVFLQFAILQASKLWAEMGATGPCPVEFTDEQAARIEKDYEEYNEALEHFEYLRGLVGANEEGWVSNEEYEETMVRNECVRRELALAGDPEDRNEIWRAWPFKDEGDESTWEDCT